MRTFSRKLKVGRTDGYELNINSWLDGDTVTTTGVSNTDGLVTVVSQSESGGIISVLLTGVSVGTAEVEFEYSTATRSDCFKAQVIVVDDC